MIVLPALAFILFVSIAFSIHKSWTRALIDGGVLLLTLSVLIAESTSLFSAYNIVWVVLCWVLIVGSLLFCRYRSKGTVNPFAGLSFALPKDLSKREKILLLLVLGTIGIVLVRIFLSPPTIPSDATVYHQPRAFMFYKNQSIHNFACSKGHMLYFGPLNAIVISQCQILCFGWDGFSPMVQFSAYLLCMVSVYRITLLLCKSREYALVGGALACLMPMAHLQASTMQSDLLVTALCTVAVSYMVQTYADLKAGDTPGVRRFAMLGFSCGLAVLAKLNAGAVLIGFALLFALLLLVKRRAGMIRDCLVVLCCAVLLTGGFWTRNAMDWNGDFLPVSYAGARPDYRQLGVRGTALISAKAIANTLTDPTKGEIPLFSGFVALSSSCANAAADLLGWELDDQRTREGSCMFTGWSHPTADQVSYPLHALLVLILLPVAVIYAIIRRKWWLFGYGLCCSLTIFIISFQYMWNASYNRYLLPAFMLAFPICVYMLQKIVHRVRGMQYVTAVLLTAMFAMNVMFSGYFVLKFGKDIFIEGYTREERVLAEHEYNPLELWHSVLEDVEANQYRKIGLLSRAQGDYIWMRPFADARYEVKYLNASVRPDLEDPEFVPDCVIAQYLADEIPETIAYHGATYRREFDPTPAFGQLEADTNCFVYYVKTS